MKKILLSFCCVFLVTVLCLSAVSCSETPQNGEKISIVCTLFPQYDWLRSIVGESQTVELTLLIDNGADAHGYQPTASDIMKIADCDMLVYIGGDSELWIREAIERSGNSEMRVIELAGLEGMTLHNISASSHSHEHEHGGHEHSVFDEHMWLSLKNAKVATSKLCEVLCELDRQNAGQYISNAQSYIGEIAALDAEFVSSVAASNEGERFMIFADRFPFVYLLWDYGIEYSAAFEGCTTDVDADFDTVIRLIDESELHNVKYITVTEKADTALAQTVIGSAKHCNMEMLRMNSLQGVTRTDIKNGTTYLGAMRENLGVIRIAINSK